MTQVTIQSAEIVYSGYASEKALAIAEDYAYNNLKDSVHYVDEDGVLCDKDGNHIDLMSGCDFGDCAERDHETIGVDYTY